MRLEGVDLLMELIVKSNYIVALTGAGISTNSGIPDFRGPQGLYSKKDLMFDRLFSIQHFKENPSFFYENFSEVLKKILNATPNKGHLFLKKLEELGKLKCVITQNIDGLHKKAGNSYVIELHGNLEKFLCMDCGKEVKSGEDNYTEAVRKAVDGVVPSCRECGGVLKPDVVFFGEYVHDLEKALTEVQKADLLLTIGTSLTVYPASTLPSYVSDSAKVIIINNQETPYDETATVVLRDDIDLVVSKLKILT